MNDQVQDGDNRPTEDEDAKGRNLDKTTFRLLPCSQKLKFIMRNVTIEPAVFLAGMIGEMSFIMIPTFILYKTCLVKLSYSDEECRNLTANATLEQEAQNLTANLSMLKEYVAQVRQCGEQYPELILSHSLDHYH